LTAKNITIEEPELFPDLVGVWQGFLSLHNARQVLAGGVMPISFAEIKSWLDIYGYQGEKRQELAHYIRVLDMRYFELLKENHAES
jgi:hypothetical protein